VIDDPMWNRVQIWMLLKDVFERTEDLFRDAGRLRDAAAEPPPPPRPGGRGNTAAGPPAPPGPPATYLKRRAALRESLRVADAALTAYAGSRQNHQCMVALTSFIDEREQVALGALAGEWELVPAQTELLGIDDGGDRFFDELDELIARPDTHGLVLEVFLLCLRSGFQGRCRDRRYELDQATARLIDRIRDEPRPPAPAGEGGAAPARRQRVSLVAFPLRYYAIAASLVLVLFAALHLISHREVMHSRLADYCHYGEAAPAGAP